MLEMKRKIIVSEIKKEELRKNWVILSLMSYKEFGMLTITSWRKMKSRT